MSKPKPNFQMLFPIFSWPFPYLQIYKQSLGHCLTKGIQLVRKQKLSATTLWVWVLKWGT